MIFWGPIFWVFWGSDPKKFRKTKLPLGKKSVQDLERKKEKKPHLGQKWVDRDEKVFYEI